MKLLMHTCCAPCSVMCIESLRNEEIEPTLYWYNPNIHPAQEYKMRKNTLVEYSKQIGAELIVNNEYGLRHFISELNNDFLSPARCSVCYRLRFEETARFAAENGFTHFTSTLFVSPYQNHDIMADTAYSMAEKYGIVFLHKDFRPYFKEGQERARMLGLYMQKYCGCIFSEEDRYIKKKQRT